MERLRQCAGSKGSTEQQNTETSHPQRLQIQRFSHNSALADGNPTHTFGPQRRANVLIACDRMVGNLHTGETAFDEITPRWPRSRY